MSLVSSLRETTSKATDTGEEYLKASARYYELKAFEQLAILACSAVKVLAIGGLLLLAMAFLAVSAAVFIGTYLNSLALGFLSIAVFFSLVALFVFLIRKKIEGKVLRNMSKSFFN